MDSMIVFIFGLLVLPGPSHTNSDKLALLAGTLKTMKRAACDDQMVSLSCPPETIISVQFAQYGKAMPGNHVCMAETLNIVGESEDCLWPTPMQYSLLQTVVQACQKKPQCKFSTKLKPGQTDPCPRSRKFVEVAYKCRPHEFRGRTGCEDDVIKLNCTSQSRLAILDAHYGRTAFEPNTCPQPLGSTDETCSALYAAEKVIHICHGRRTCEIVVANDTFGSNCRSNSRNNFEVQYACVPNGILDERYETDTEENEADNNLDNNRNENRFEGPDDDSKWREPNAISPNVPIPMLPMNNEDEDTLSKHQTNVNNKGSRSTDTSKHSSNTKFFIYISVGILVIVVVIAVLIAVHCYKNRQRDRNSKNGDMFTTETPNVFNDASSDIDNDVDVSHISGSFYDPVHPDMIIYRDGQTKTALRAMKPLSTVYPCAGTSMYGHVDYKPSRNVGFDIREDPEVMMSPKSLHGYTNSQFYYG